MSTPKFSLKILYRKHIIDFPGFITFALRLCVLSRSICFIKLWNKNEEQSAKDNNHSSKPNCRLSYPGYAVTDGKWEKYSKRLTLNWDFPREEEYLIEINDVSNRQKLGSFPELERRYEDGDKLIGALSERRRSLQGRIHRFNIEGIFVVNKVICMVSYFFESP